MNNEAECSHFGNLFHAASSGNTAVVWFQMSLALFDLIAILFVLPLMRGYLNNIYI